MEIMKQKDYGMVGAAMPHSDSAAVNFVNFDISQYKNILVEGENVLAIHGLNISETSSDMLIRAEIMATDQVTEISETAIAYTSPIAINQSVQIKSRTLYNGVWSALKVASYQVGNASLVITEINYNPHNAMTQFGELDVDNDEFEFIEIMNTGVSSQILQGVRLIIGDPLNLNSVFTFGSGITLQPNERLVVVKNQAAFESRYGTGIFIAGQYNTKLRNSGDAIQLRDILGNQLTSFEYNDSSSWPSRADGKSSTLVLKDTSTTNSDLSDGDTWRSSTKFGGSPGQEELDAAPSIIISEVLTHTDMPTTDQIEIYNYGNTIISLSGWYLSDNKGNYMSYQFDDNMTLDPNEYLVLNESDFNVLDSGNSSSQPFALSGSHGDSLYFIGVDQNGKPSVFVDHVKFGAAFNANLPEGTSLGRLRGDVTTVRLVHLDYSTIGSVNSGHRISDVVISEVNYNTTGDDNFFRIYRNIQPVRSRDRY